MHGSPLQNERDRVMCVSPGLVKPCIDDIKSRAPFLMDCTMFKGNIVLYSYDGTRQGTGIKKDAVLFIRDKRLFLNQDLKLYCGR